jgi:hypothetical protein
MSSVDREPDLPPEVDRPLRWGVFYSECSISALQPPRVLSFGRGGTQCERSVEPQACLGSYLLEYQSSLASPEEEVRHPVSYVCGEDAQPCTRDDITYPMPIVEDATKTGERR